MRGFLAFGLCLLCVLGADFAFADASAAAYNVEKGVRVYRNELDATLLAEKKARYQAYLQKQQQLAEQAREAKAREQQQRAWEDAYARGFEQGYERARQQVRTYRPGYRSSRVRRSRYGYGRRYSTSFSTPRSHRRYGSYYRPYARYGTSGGYYRPAYFVRSTITGRH